MYIFVKTFSGSLLRIDCEPSDTIENIKCKIQENLGIPPYAYFLKYFSKILQEDHTLADYNIKKESTVYMSLRMKFDFTVIFNGVEYIRPGYYEETGRILKEFMFTKTGIDMDYIELKCDDITLEDNTSLNKIINNVNQIIMMNIKNDENLKRIKIIYNERIFTIFCEEPLELNNIKYLVKKNINELDQFQIELIYHSKILTNEDDLDSYSIDELTVVHW